MAKTDNNSPLSFTEIVLRAEASVIQQAYEARLKIDGYLAERAKAYELIAQLEEQIDDVLGEAGAFPFPEPPLPVAGFTGKGGSANRPIATKKAAPKPTPKPAAPEAPKSEVKDTLPPSTPSPADALKDEDEQN